MIRRLAPGLWLAGAWIVLAAGWARAQEQTETLEPRSMAMGEAMRAEATGSLAIELNPSGLALSRAYALEATFGYRPEDHANVETASVCDSMTSRVGVCLYYKHLGSSTNTDLDEPHLSLNEGGITISTPMSDAIMVGITQKYSSLSETVGTSGLTDQSHSGFMMDAGLTIKPAQSLNLAAVMYNVYGGDSNQYARALGFGVGINLGQSFIVAADTRYDLSHSTGRWGAGAEYSVGGENGQGFPLRIGYVYDAAGSASYITGGLGYTTPRVAVDASLRKQVSNGDELIFVFGLRVFLPS